MAKPLQGGIWLPTQLTRQSPKFAVDLVVIEPTCRLHQSVPDLSAFKKTRGPPSSALIVIRGHQVTVGLWIGSKIPVPFAPSQQQAGIRCVSPVLPQLSQRLDQRKSLVALPLGEIVQFGMASDIQPAALEVFMLRKLKKSLRCALVVAIFTMRQLRRMYSCISALIQWIANDTSRTPLSGS